METSRHNWKSVGRTILRRSVLIVLPCIRGSSQRLPTSWRCARTGRSLMYIRDVLRVRGFAISQQSVANILARREAVVGGSA